MKLALVILVSFLGVCIIQNIFIKILFGFILVCFAFYWCKQQIDILFEDC